MQREGSTRMSRMPAALVTGASARIGLAIATRLAETGYDVALHASPRSREMAERHADDLRARGLRARVVIADLADAGECQKLVPAAVSAVGPLSLLVNNAAIFEPDDAAAIDLAVWNRQFAINLTAPVVLAGIFAAQAPPGGSIVNIVDQRVLRPGPQQFSYTLAKSALWTATQMMAQAFAAQGIRVNAVAPGPVLPNRHDGHAGFTREVARLPLQRAVEPFDVVESVLYLATAQAATGQLIAVDSGQHFIWPTQVPGA